MSEDFENICYICYDKIDDTNIQKLSCSHVFHYECIKHSYISDKKNYTIRKCPYCRQNGGYIEYKPNTLPIKDIHKEYYDFIKNVKKNNKEELKKYLDCNKCFSILKTGKNAGTQCNNKPFSDGYCKKHTPSS